ncbi:sulfatase-like hydrolase/transferase [Parapedobacter sp. DT-150]|uniref:sulfatase-like hydrolase/transferase n=1 Tax=Parapedobacter sp. DT-150 TaxID=3396162 RepID=UPI003F1A9CFC
MRLALLILCLFHGACFSACAVAQNTQSPRRPNIIVFLVDDLGYSDVSCYGSDYYETPHIDRLAKSGMRFTHAYASSTLCSPTRASLLTGKNPARLHITHAIPIQGYKRIDEGKGTPLKDADYVMNLPLEEETIAEALKADGYTTASIGKWHVCDDPAYYPEYQGFDVSIGGNHHGHTGEHFYPYHARWRMAEGQPWVEWNTLPDGKPGEYLTDRLTAEAVDFIESNRDKPFFLYLSHYAVHTPIQAKKDIQARYERKTPDSLKGHVKPAYAAMIESVDASMGTVMGKLAASGLAENTIIIFTSDNGGFGRQTSNYPFRGNKGNFYEGGIRVPLIIRWPGVTDKASVSEVPVITTDLYPSILEMAGLPLLPDQHKDGISILPVLKQKGTLARDALYWHFPNYVGTGHPNPSAPLSAIRYGDWKLIESLEDGMLELYDLKSDITESRNLASVNKDTAAALLSMLETWRKETGVQMPPINPAYVLPPAAQSQWQVPVLINKNNNPVLQIKVAVPEEVEDAWLEEIQLTTEGTTQLSDISAVRVYYYGTDSVAGNMNEIQKPLFGESKLSEQAVQMTGRQLLQPGDNYLWVSYELSPSTNLDHLVAARCVSLRVGGKTIEVSPPAQPIRQRVGVAVRKHMQDGVHTARIPGLARTNDGTLLAIFDARYESARDLQGHMDIGLHRSSDNGQSWEPLQIVLDMDEWDGLPQKFNGVSDACVLVDKNTNTIYIAGLWMHGVINEAGKWIEGLTEKSDDWNHQWRNKGSQPGFGERQTAQFLIVKSTDGGKSWSKPTNLTRMCKKAEWWLWAPAPGNGITMADGTLVFPTQGRNKNGESFSNITYSTDGGITWKTSNPAYSGTTECAVAQLTDNSLMLNMRFSANKGKSGDDNGRAVAITNDLGNSWTMHSSSFHALPEPVCMASLYNHGAILLFSNPNSKQFREDMTIKISHDRGKTWPAQHWILLDEGRSRGYSCLTAVDEGHVGILYESSQADLVFQRVDIDQISNN